MPNRKRVYDARPDTLDFRDVLFTPTLIEVPPVLPLDEYRAAEAPILDQGSEGACTGFGLAAVANFLLRRRAQSFQLTDPEEVSARMLYEMARRYDEWPGENYEGSSARGAMKGWHKHGVCAKKYWNHDPGAKPGKVTADRIQKAAEFPLGAYFRVNHKDLVAMHSALAEVKILYATSQVHEGWDHINSRGQITYKADTKILGGHAFAIVAYDKKGFWLQNSWGSDWGHHGFAHISYDDWLENGTDVWVARLGVPVELATDRGIATAFSSRNSKSTSYSFQDLRPHIILCGNDGQLNPNGQFGSDRNSVREIFSQHIPGLTKTWSRKRILLYAHGGLVGEDSAVQRIADYRERMLKNEIYPLAFIWKSDLWNTIANLLRDAAKSRKPEGIFDAAKDFMLDRLDDALEPIARLAGGKPLWGEMKENAERATTTRQGAARIAAEYLAQAVASGAIDEIHIAGHSAGSIFLGPLLTHLTSDHQLKIETCTLWAAACTTGFFNQHYTPLIGKPKLGRMALFNLSDRAERDDHCAHVYQKSLLYLVSHAFEEKARVPWISPDGTPIAGMEKHALKDPQISARIKSGALEHILAPNHHPEGNENASEARAHGAFDDDENTVQALMARIKKTRRVTAPVEFQRSSSSARDRRSALNALVAS